jgi:hypothetical protein
MYNVNNIMKNVLIFRAIVYFIIYCALSYCFIYDGNSENVYVKSFFSFLLLIFIFEIYKEANDLYQDYATGTVLQKCMNVYDIADYKTDSVKRDINSTMFEYNSNFYDLKLKDFYIPCSYQSYLPCGNSYQLYHLDNIGNILKRGARCIHLDVYPDIIGNFDPSVEPVVRGSNMTKFFGKPLNFEECLYSVLNNGFENTNTPLILYLEFSQEALKNNNLMKKCGSKVNDAFSHNLHEYDSNNLENINLGDTLISQLLNKIIIITNYKERKGIFNSITWPTPEILDFNNTLKSRYTKERLEEIKEQSKTKLFIAKPNNHFITLNYRDSKEDLVNLEKKEEWYGINMVFMNYQLFDEPMKKYMDFFKYEPLVIKDISLRELPVKEIIKQEEVLDDFETISQKTDSGGTWATINL